MSLHPTIHEAVQRLARETPIDQFDVPEGRRRMRARPVPNVKKAPVSSIVNVDIPGRNGTVPIRIYTPRGKGPFPVTMFFHGGGFCYMDVDAYDVTCQALCDGSGSIVVSVEYRLAPEHPYPAGNEDCLDAVKWFAEHGRHHDADPSRMVLAGDSAGGCLAATTALRIRDHGGPELKGQLLFYPMMDHYSANWPTFGMYGDGNFGLRGGLIKLCWDSYLNSEKEIEDPWAVPLRASSFAGLPEALVQSAEFDLARDEGEAYAKKLREAGVQVELTRCTGLNHGFLNWWGILPESNERLDEACKWLRRVLSADR